jgi:hypothetical protein
MFLLALPATGCLPASGPWAQGMMEHVDLASPRMTMAELTRIDVEAMIRAAKPGTPLDLADKGLNGLDLSGLDLAGADLRRSRLNHAKLVGTRLDDAKLDMAWAMDADFSDASLQRAGLYQAQFPRAKFDRADLANARIIGTFDGGSFVGARLIDANGAPDDAGIRAETLPPRAIAQDHHPGSAGLVVRGSGHPPEGCLHAEEREEITADVQAGELLGRLPRLAQVDRIAGVNGQVGE